MTLFADEAALEAKVIELAEANGWAVMKVNKASNRTPTKIVGVIGTHGRGWPDLTLWHPEHGLIFRELKMRGKKVRPEQPLVLASLSAAEQDATVWWSDEYDTLITETLKGTR